MQIIFKKNESEASSLNLNHLPIKTTTTTITTKPNCELPLQRMVTGILVQFLKFQLWAASSFPQVSSVQVYAHQVTSVMSDSATPWTAAHQAPLSMGIFQARTLEWVALPSGLKLRVKVVWRIWGPFTDFFPFWDSTHSPVVTFVSGSFLWFIWPERPETFSPEVLASPVASPAATAADLRPKPQKSGTACLLLAPTFNISPKSTFFYTISRAHNCIKKKKNFLSL